MFSCTNLFCSFCANTIPFSYVTPERNEIPRDSPRNFRLVSTLHQVQKAVDYPMPMINPIYPIVADE